MSNSVDPDETAHMSRLILICAVCKSLLLSPVAVKDLMTFGKSIAAFDALIISTADCIIIIIIILFWGWGLGGIFRYFLDSFLFLYVMVLYFILIL